MTYTFEIVATRTGVRQVQVFPSAGSWSRVLNGSGKGSHSFVLSPLSTPLLDRNVMSDKSLSDPWNRTLVVCWDGVPVYAGVITKRVYDRDTKTLTIHHEDIRSILERRYPFGTASYWADEPNHIPGSLTITSKSMRAAAAKVVEQGLLGTSAIYSLPILLPSTAEAGTFTTTYYNYNFQTVADLLQDLQKAGPDIDFAPEWNAGALRWVMNAGSTATPRLSGSLIDFNLSVDKSPLTGVTFTEDGGRQLTGQFGIGEGFEVDMRVGGAGIAGAATIPALDALDNYKTEESEPKLAAYGLAAVTANTLPTKQWEFSMRAGEGPGLLGLLGWPRLRLHSNDDPWIPGPYTDVRLISLSGDMSDSLVLDVQDWV